MVQISVILVVTSLRDKTILIILFWISNASSRGINIALSRTRTMQCAQSSYNCTHAQETEGCCHGKHKSPSDVTRSRKPFAEFMHGDGTTDSDSCAVMDFLLKSEVSSLTLQMTRSRVVIGSQRRSGRYEYDVGTSVQCQLMM